MDTDTDIQIFVVFHKYIFDDCYRNIPHDILQKYFTFYAVNEHIPKHYTSDKYKIVNEWELPIYDKTFQERGYNENSALYHVYANNLHKNYKYVGFFQYDMEFNDNIIEFLQKHITDVPIRFCLECYNFDFCATITWNEPKTREYVIQDYETFYKTKFSKTRQYPLLNTYVISKETYEKIMQWVVQLYDKIYPWCVEPPNIEGFGHIGGIYERIMAFAIGEEDLQNIFINVKHDHRYKTLSY